MMFNKKNLFRWISTSFLLYILCLLCFSFKGNQHSSLPLELQKLINQSSGSDGFSPKKMEEGYYKLEAMKKSSSSPQELFEKIKDNYEREAIFIRGNGYPRISSGWEHNVEWRKKTDGYGDFSKNNYYEFTYRDRPNIAFRSLYRMKEYLPLQGKFESIGFAKKIDEKSKISIEEQASKFTYSDYIENGMSSSSGSNKVIEKATFRHEASFYESGLYAIQFHYYPDDLMVKTVDGIIKSPIYWLRVKE